MDKLFCISKDNTKIHYCMFSLLFNFQNIRYTVYVGFFFYFMKRRNCEIKQITYENETVKKISNTTDCNEWGQFIEIDCY